MNSKSHDQFWCSRSNLGIITPRNVESEVCLHGLGPRSVILAGWPRGQERHWNHRRKRGRDREGVTSSRPNDCCTLNFSVLLHQGMSKQLDHRLSDSIWRDIKNYSPALQSSSQMCVREWHQETMSSFLLGAAQLQRRRQWLLLSFSCALLRGRRERRRGILDDPSGQFVLTMSGAGPSSTSAAWGFSFSTQSNTNVPS